MMGSDIVYFLFACSLFEVVTALYLLEGSNYKKCGAVHLTVSSLRDTYLELNWITDCDPKDDKPDFIALYDSDPRERNEEVHPRTYVYAKEHPSGFYRTKVKFGHPYLPGNWEPRPNMTKADMGPQCFPYWIAAIKSNGGIVDVRCLAIQPTWMNDNRDKLGTQRIGGIMIPGTHNSGSNEGMPTFLENYILNQDRSIWTQLVFGIRYFDFRIGYYEKEGSFYINHDLVRVQPLLPALHEIKQFLELAPKEIIVLDFHRFPFPSNFGHSLHRKLHELLRDQFEHLALAPNGLQAGKGPTLNEIWYQNKNIIICYGKLDIAREYNWYWNPLPQHWGNKNKVKDLKSFLSNTIQEHRAIQNPMWALMAELTPQPIDLLFRTNNLRKLADDVNRHVTKWFRDEWFHEANIVATDYFLGNDIINVAIEVNRNR